MTDGVSAGVLKVARSVHSALPGLLGNKINVFLIGKSISDPTSIRAQLLEDLKKWSRVRVYYPEDLFMELIYGANLDLLELETVLARSVNVVVMCVESWGSVAELGAFASHTTLSNRLVLVCDSNRKKDQSFINLGPVRHVRKSKTSKVLFHDFDRPVGDFAKAVRAAIRRVAMTTKTVQRLSNLVVAETFVLAAVSTLGPISWSQLHRIVMQLETTEASRATIVCSSALSSLFKQRAVLLQDGMYEITTKGRNMLHSIGTWDSKMIEAFDTLRVDVLNLKLRKEYSFGEKTATL